MEINERSIKGKTVIVKCLLMLGISVFMIGGMLLCGKCTLLAGEQTVELALSKKNDTDNAAFSVGNMFPGDKVTGNYCIKVSYDEAVTLNFRVDIAEGYEKLAEVLKCNVVLAATGEVLHDGLLKDVPDAIEVALTDTQKGEAELIYKITAYLDTSVGNEYQNKVLEADFVWWIEGEEDTDSDTDEEGSGQTPSDTDEEGSDQTPSDTDEEGEEAESTDVEESTAGAVDETMTEVPNAGDDTNMLLWLVVAVCAAALIVTIIVKKQKGGQKV